MEVGTCSSRFSKACNFESNIFNPFGSKLAKSKARERDLSPVAAKEGGKTVLRDRWHSERDSREAIERIVGKNSSTRLVKCEKLRWRTPSSAALTSKMLT